MIKSVQGFVDNIEKLVVGNANFRQVVYTAKHSHPRSG